MTSYVITFEDNNKQVDLTAYNNVIEPLQLDKKHMKSAIFKLDKRCDINYNYKRIITKIDFHQKENKEINIAETKEKLLFT